MSEAKVDLTHLRSQISELDEKIVALIAERFRVIGEVDKEKAHTSAAIVDPKRERTVLDSVEKIARREGAPIDLVRRMYRDLLDESVTRQISRRRDETRERDFG